jgi:hypothetical protein
MRGHVDAESLALYAEGQLSRGRTAHVRAHLSGCAECGRTEAALASVTTELSQVPVPPLPSAVAARLDAALSAESAHRSAPEPAPTPPPRRNRWSPGALRILAATAVTLVVAGGAGYALSQFSGSATSGASAPSAQKPSHRSIQAGPLVSPGGRMVKPNTSSPSGPAYARTSTNYQRATLAKQAQRQLAAYTVSGMSGPGQVAADRIPAQFRACAIRLADGRPLLLVDLAKYQRRPAIVIVAGPPDKAIAASYSCVPLHSARVTVRG